MSKIYSKKFWIIFWLISILFLVSFYLTLEFRKNGLTGISEKMPISQELKTVFALADHVFLADGTEKNFLILFQNNMEIRPGGGYIGSFGILKIKDGKYSNLQIHDAGIFDERIPDVVEAPRPIQEKLNVAIWKLRDSNFSPDFKVNAIQAEKFYKLGKGEEELDGIIGITTDVLTSFLEITGPVSIEGYPGTYGDENAFMQLEYQVEKGFDEQGIPRRERKSGIMNKLGREVLSKTLALGKVDQLRLAKVVLKDLKKKDIQFYFKDEDLQKAIDLVGWNGEVDTDWNKDFLMLVDANLGAWKSDYFMKRLVEYTVDLSQEIPQANLKVTYKHAATAKDWLTKNYLTYFQVFTVEESWLDKTENFINPIFKKDLGKKSFGAYVDVVIGKEKVVKLSYTLPQELANDYILKIQKQIGVNDVPYKVKVIQRDGSEKNYEFILNSDIILN